MLADLAPTPLADAAVNNAVLADEAARLNHGVPIRSVSRSLAVLKVVNREGSLSMNDIARRSGVPYATACRIVQTLICEGLLEQEPTRKYYRPTELVQTLSSGFSGHSRLTAVARPHIVALTQRHLWPVTLSTRVGATMLVRDSTHDLTTLCFNTCHPGHSFPLPECAAGRAYLAFADDRERAAIFGSIRHSGVDMEPHTLSLMQSSDFLDEIRRAGVAIRGASRFSQAPGKSLSVAAPIFRDGAICGAVTMIIFASSMRLDDAAARLGPPLVATGREISSALSRAGS